MSNFIPPNDTFTLEQIYLDYVEKKGFEVDLDQLNTISYFEQTYRYFQTLHTPKNWINHFKSLFYKPPERPRNFYLYGPPGRGKSMVMDIFYAHIPGTQKMRIHFHQFMYQVHHKLALLRKQQTIKPVQKVAQSIADECNLICFDEFDVQDIGDAMILGPFFKALLDAKCNIIATSNTPIKDLYLNGLQRSNFLPFINLMQQCFTQIDFDHGGDYRKQHKVLNDLICQIDGYQNIPSLLQKIDYDFKLQPVIININDHDFQFSGTGPLSAMIRFEDLCAKPSSAADYLILVKKYPLLMISEIPILTAEHLNDSKRLANLIDIYYDHKKLLGLSCYTKPQELFDVFGERYARIRSRILQMAGKKWQEPKIKQIQGSKYKPR